MDEDNEIIQPTDDLEQIEDSNSSVTPVARDRASRYPNRTKYNKYNIPNSKKTRPRQVENNQENRADNSSLPKSNSARTPNDNIVENKNRVSMMNKQIGGTSKSKSSIKGFLKTPMGKKILIKATLIILPIAILGLLIVYMISSFVDGNKKSGLVLGGYYSVRCPEVTVIFVDKQNGYTETGSKTYSLEEYVAGVIAGEVAYLGNYEVDKVYAIAARSYFLTHDDGNCTIEASDRKQAFRELTENQNDQMALQAAEETAGQVLLKNNEVYGSQYDAFACIAEDSNYYTISQGNQKIPKEWVESRINKERHPNWFICNGKENLSNHHGNGMSQFGALYLASEKGYTYDEIISFYLGDEVKISSNGLMTSVAGLEIKNTTNSQLLTAPISNILSTNGATIKDMDDFIYRNVTEAGKGTREAVVTAAVSQINYLYDNYKVRAPYYWGGNYQRYGMPSNLGAKTVTSCSSTSCYYNVGFDCSGFVSWAIKNGGYTLNRLTTVGFDSKFSSNSCNIKDSNCIGQPGDLINSRECHVQMIVAVDESSGKYMVAESTGSLGVVMREWNMHSSNCGNSETRILHMDSYYNNSNNVDPNY